MRHLEAACGLAAPSWVFGSEVIAQIPLYRLSPLKLEWKKNLRPYRTHGCQKDREVISLTPLGMGSHHFRGQRAPLGRT